MESNSVDFHGSRDHEDNVTLSGKVNSEETDEDNTLPVDGAVSSSRSRSLTLVENLDEKRHESGTPELRRSTLPRTGNDRTRSASVTTVASVRPLPKALQPKETRRGLQSMVPTQTVIYKAATGHSQLSSGVNVSDSVLRQQRRSSASEFAISPTTSPPNIASLHHVSAKPEVVSKPSDTQNGSSVGSRRVVCDPNPGLMMLRHHMTKETKPYRPQVKIPSRGPQKSFSDLLAVFQTPDTTSYRPKSTRYTPTTSKYSKFNKPTFEYDKPQSNLTEEPIENSVSVSTAVYDPSPTISRLMRKQQSGVPGQKRLDMQASSSEPIPLQTGESITSPAAKEESSDCVSTTSTTSDSIELSSEFVDSNSSSLEVELPVGLEKTADMDQGWSDMPGSNLEAATKVVEETVNKAAEDDDDDDDDVDDENKAIFESDDVFNSDVKDPPPPLPGFPLPQIYSKDEGASHDENRYVRLFFSTAKARFPLPELTARVNG